MNLKKILTLTGMMFVVLILIGAFAFNDQGKDERLSCSREFSLDGCTVIMVGKNASTDGSVIATHTCDCGLCDWIFCCIFLVYYKEGMMWKIYYIN